MKLLNNGKAIQMTFNSSDVNIPEGEFEVIDVGLALFIENKARSWNLDIKIIDEKNPTTQAEKIRKIEKVEEAPKDEAPKKATPKK